MKATGVIVEYNPFHNGHIYHVLQSKKKTEADVVIAVMSGNFLQRGEPAFVDKWTRSKMALTTGVDIVFELPYAFATGHAPLFAKGSIEILDAAGCASFCFGSEDGDVKPFENSIQLIEQSAEQYDETVKENVKHGLSYPKALNEAYKLIGQAQVSLNPLADLTQPNNILGFHYMNAAREIQSSMEATTIQRIGANFHDEIKENQEIASATGIRNSFLNSSDLDDIAKFIPPITREVLSEWQKSYKTFGSWTLFYPYLRFIILRDGPERLSSIADITEGIENLMYRAAKSNDTFEGFMNVVKSKRYTWTRIQRMLTHIFTGYTYATRNKIKSPSYLRLLGMTANGQAYLNKNKKRLKLPLVSKVSAFSNVSLDFDIHAADMYAFGIANTNSPVLGKDYKQSPLII